MRKITKSIRNAIVFRGTGSLETHLCFRYQKLLSGRFITKGQKIRALNKLLDLKLQLKLREHLDPNLIFTVSMLKSTPLIFLLPIRLGSFRHGVPMPISEKKQVTFAVKWVVKAATLSKGSISIPILADILVATIYDQGSIYDKKLLTYETGLKNRHLQKFFK